MYIALKTPNTKNATVKRIQQLLVVLNYLPAGSDDGVYGTKSTQAVKMFQSAIGITADGIVGNQTFTALVLFAAAKRAAAQVNPLTLALIWHDSAFWPNTKYSIGGSGLLATTEPFPSIPLVWGKPDSDGVAAQAETMLVQQWVAEVAYVGGIINDLSTRVFGLAQRTFNAAIARIVALWHRVQGDPADAVLQRPEVRAAGWAWTAITAADYDAIAQTKPISANLVRATIAAGYVDKVLAAAAKFAPISGTPAAIFLGDPSLPAANPPPGVKPTQPPAQPVAVTPTAPAVLATSTWSETTAPGASSSPAATAKAPSTSTPAVVPLSSPDDDLPPEPPYPAASAPSSPAIVTPPASGAVQTAGARGGGGALLLGGLVLLAFAGGRGGRSGGRKRKGGTKKKRKR